MCVCVCVCVCVQLRMFYAEHLHKDQEIRLITAGSGYFEIRDYDDKWIRLHLKKGDLIHLPPGIYHRLTLDSGVSYSCAMEWSTRVVSTLCKFCIEANDHLDSG